MKGSIITIMVINFHGLMRVMVITQERPIGKGRRWCFISAMSSDGLITETRKIFEAKNKYR